MGKHARHLSRGNGLEPTATTLLDEPLEFIHEDHLREREICSSIDKIAEGTRTAVGSIKDVIGFLTKELPLHLMDEEEDLFPLLKRRCEPEDQIGKVIARLLRDHDHAAVDTPQIIDLLNEVVQTPRVLDGAERGVLAAYANHARRHLILENAIILPFARLRLTKDDLETLHIRMCQRRGLGQPREIVK
ncbi:MAG: hemerythrin domain-containing protein [Pseudomonadota bacterium]